MIKLTGARAQTHFHTSSENNRDFAENKMAYKSFKYIKKRYRLSCKDKGENT